MHNKKEPMFVVSKAKAGRTWLRFILAEYMNRIYKLGIEMDFHEIFKMMPNYDFDPNRGFPTYAYYNDNRMPLIIFTHRSYNGKIACRKTLFMVRNPWDTLYSHYLQQRHRKRTFLGSFSEFIRLPGAGIHYYVEYHNQWLHNNRNIDMQLLAYERMRHDPVDEFQKVLLFFGLPVEEKIVEAALVQSTIDQMQKIEITSGFPSPEIYLDAKNISSLRARKGSVGDSVHNMEEKDLRYIQDFINTDLQPNVMSLMTKSGVILDCDAFST